MPDKNRKLIEEFKALGAPAASPQPRATKVSQFEKDFRDYLAAQQEARQQLTSDLVSPSRAANAAVPGAVGALTGYGSQILGAPGDIVGLYEEFKPESFRSAPASLQALPSTEQVQQLFAPKADSFMGRRMPEYEAGITAGNLYALGEGVAALPSLARGVGRGAKALGKEAGRRIDEAMMTGEGMLGSALAPARPNFIKAYHGTPHRFPPTAKNPLGEFDPTKIGTGEGNQAYGYGHYLAEQKDVAKSYANDVAGIASARGSQVKPAPEESIAYDVQNFLGEDIGGHAADRAEKVYSRGGKTIYEFEDGSLGSLDSQGNFQAFAKPESSLYKVDLPDEHIARMLDWDKSLSEQTESVQKVLRDLADRDAKIYGEGGGLDYYMGDPESYSGESVYRYLTEQLNGMPETSKFFKNANIPGIKYFDASSRDAGEGTRNFVVFPDNENLLTIEERMKKGGTVSQDAMRMKAWDKQVQGKAAGGLTKVGKGIGKAIDVVTELKAAPKAGVFKPKRVQTVSEPQRMAFPGIYQRPDVIASEAASRVAPEDPALKQIFGVTREDLYQLGKSRQGNLPGELPGQAANPRGSAAAEAVMTRRNRQRILDVNAEAEKHPLLVQGMDPWYVMDPLYKRMVQLLGPEQANIEYRKMNTLMGMASPGSEVLTEIPRGTAAYFLQKQGRFPEFVEHLGKPEGLRGDVPSDIINVPGHMYHQTAQATPMGQYLETGELQMKSPKVPMYIEASQVPEIGFQTRTPVGDAHWSRAVGLADTRGARTIKGKEAVPGASVSNPEMAQLAPWWREQIAKELGIESVPAQARTWGVFSGQTGVTTPIGAPKLELLAQKIMETAERLGVSPETARDMVITGQTYAGKKDGGAVHMAEGGMTSDDLIVEERPL